VGRTGCPEPPLRVWMIEAGRRRAPVGRVGMAGKRKKPAASAENRVGAVYSRPRAFERTEAGPGMAENEDFLWSGWLGTAGC
jgi:hypothetical protein